MRDQRVMHNHFTQIKPKDVGLELAETIAAGCEPCPACQLIRVKAVHPAFYPYDNIGPTPEP